LLFDNIKDPFQKVNLVNDNKYAGLKRKLEKALQKKLKEMKDEFLPGQKYIDKWGYQVDETGTVPYKQ